MKQALKDIVFITNDTHSGKTRAYTALSQIQTIALDAIRESNHPTKHTSEYVTIGIVSGMWFMILFNVFLRWLG